MGERRRLELARDSDTVRAGLRICRFRFSSLASFPNLTRAARVADSRVESRAGLKDSHGNESGMHCDPRRFECKRVVMRMRSGGAIRLSNSQMSLYTAEEGCQGCQHCQISPGHLFGSLGSVSKPWRCSPCRDRIAESATRRDNSVVTAPPPGYFPAIPHVLMARGGNQPVAISAIGSLKSTKSKLPLTETSR
jgi:hypothetical protein